MHADLNILTQLGEISVEHFLKTYWQKKPLLIRNAFPNLPNIAADELAGFALDEDLESRLIVETPKDNKPFESDWSCLHGPLTEQNFTDLADKTHWTLLVQAVNQLSEPLHHFLHRFRFLPNWRIDDLMVSYASDQGSVGPHFDYYDVFLVQAQGQRHWRLGQNCSAQTPQRDDTPLSLVTDFETSEEYTLNPGDTLYVPPGLAHWGIAQGECMTYSVGFRAPSHGELLLDFAQQQASLSQADARLGDAGRAPAKSPGEISTQDIQKARDALQVFLQDEKAFENWFGAYITQTKRNSLCFEPNQPGLRLAPYCIAAFIPNGKNGATLFINGESFEVSVQLAEQICAYQSIDASKTTETENALLLVWQKNDWLIEGIQ